MFAKPRWLAGLAATALAVSLSPLLAASPATAAERPDSLGKDFWLTFPRNHFGTPELQLFISGPTATSGTVAVPGLSFSQNFTVNPGVVTTVAVPDGAQLSAGDSGDPEQRAIQVTANDEVSVYGLNRIQFSTDAFMGLPVDVLAKEYVVLSYPALGQASEFAVAATEDGTEVTYVPAADTTAGVTAGTSTTKMLSRGEALPVSSSTGDLSGTVITSTKPVAVFGGQSCANVPDATIRYCDHLVEQLPGTPTWGKSFQTVPLKTRLNGDTFRMVASENATTVAVNGVAVATLNRGQVHQQIIDGQATITSDKPILAAQYSNGTTYDGVEADPFMMLLIPSEQFLNQYTFATPETGFARNFVNVVTADAGVGQVQLDGAVVPAGQFSAIGSTGFSGAQVDLTAGSHTMSSSQPFGIYVYGFDDDDSYGYPGGAAFASINAVAALTLTPPAQTVKVNTQACLDTTVLDKENKPLAGIDVKLKVEGVNPTTTSGFTNASGVLQHCYTSSKLGKDTVTATYGTLSAAATVTWVSATPPPTKRKKLPINKKKVKKSPVSLGQNGKVRLVKSIKTNKHGKTSIRVFCIPTKASAAGEVRFCDTNVTKKGKITVRSTGYDSLRVRVVVKAKPKKGQADTWRRNTWRKSWKVRP
ncbi:MAG: hypothetical protein V9G09_06585 [Candidatus Nanopelagicales bacterium]|nr:Ig-like domain-containing protein [Micrococcales bacterium]